jgi:hypothetical protein
MLFHVSVFAVPTMEAACGEWNLRLGNAAASTHGPKVRGQSGEQILPTQTPTACLGQPVPQRAKRPHPFTPSPLPSPRGEREEGEGSCGAGSFLNFEGPGKAGGKRSGTPFIRSCAARLRRLGAASPPVNRGGASNPSSGPRRLMSAPVAVHLLPREKEKRFSCSGAAPHIVVRSRARRKKRARASALQILPLRGERVARASRSHQRARVG